MQRQTAAGRLGQGHVRLRRLLLAGIPVLLLAAPALAQTRSGGPAWSQLSSQQREALAPLSGQWETIPADGKKKWLEIAARYPQLSPEGKERVRARMAEFAQLTPEQRSTARENFQRAYELPRESRESAVQQYKSLPEERKKELSDRGRRRDSAQSPEKK